MTPGRGAAGPGASGISLLALVERQRDDLVRLVRAADVHAHASVPGAAKAASTYAMAIGLPRVGEGRRR